MKKILILTLCLCTFSFVPAYANGISYEYSADSFSFEVERGEDGAVGENDRISIAMLQPGFEFGTLGGSAENYKFVKTYNPSGEDVSYKYTFAEGKDEYGRHSVRLIVTHNDGSYEAVSKNFYFVSDQDVLQMCTAIVTAGASNLNDVIKEYAGEKEFLKVDEITEITDAKNPSLSPEICSTYELIRDIYKNTDGFGFNEAMDGENALKTTMLANYLLNGSRSEFSDAFDKYADATEGLIDVKVDEEVYYDFFQTFKPEAQTYEKLHDALVKNTLLTLINNGTQQDFIDAVTKYGYIYDIDVDAVKESGVAIGDIAKQMNLKNTITYAENFGNAFDEIADKLDTKTVNDNETISSRPSGTGSTGTGKKLNTLVIDPAAEPQTEESDFTDVSPAMWAYDSIMRLKDKGSINGFEDHSFLPNQTITREQFIKILVEALSIKAMESKDMAFADCEKNSWYYPYIKIAFSNNLMKGIDVVTAGIGREITREDMAVIICKAAGIGVVTEIPEFSDSAEISDYAKNYVALIQKKGIIGGYEDGSFRPKNSVTRAETAVVICRVIDYMNGGAQ